MNFLGLYITTAKAEREHRVKDNILIGKLLSEKAFLQKGTEKLLAIVKGSRQVRRGAERRLYKI